MVRWLKSNKILEMEMLKKCRSVMKIPVIWSSSNSTILDAAKIMMKNNIGALPLVDDNKLVGIITRTDVIKTIPY